MAEVVTKTAKLVCFAGAGGTGKTSVVDGLYARLVDSSGKHLATIHRSVVRDFYKINSIANEASFLKLSAHARFEFQMRLFDYYLDKLSVAVRSSTTDLVLCERSVFDHFAYTLYGTRELLDEKGYNHLAMGIRRFVMFEPSVFYMAYPTPWDHMGGDNFRARELAKDTIIDAVIHRQLSTNRRVWKGTLPHTDVAKRVDQVMRHLHGVE